MKSPLNALSFIRSRTSHINLNNPGPHINHLPVELLGQVFLLIVSEMPNCPTIFTFGDTSISANFSSPPLLFTHVCRHWRLVAHSTAEIWSRVEVVIPRALTPLKPFLPRLLQFWLACSGNLQLTIRIVPEPPRRRHRLWGQRKHKPFTWFRKESHPQLLDVLLSERMRWVELTITSDILTWPWGIYAPQLRTLECSWSDISRFSAPSLCSLHTFTRFDGFTPIFACKNMRHLHLEIAYPFSIQNALEAFPHLETIAVDFMVTDHGIWESTNSVTHSCIQSITLPLSCDPDGQIQFLNIFGGLRLPMLQILNIIGAPRRQEVNCIMAALAGASRNMPELEFLEAIPSMEFDADVVKLLHSVARKVTVCTIPSRRCQIRDVLYKK
jgi:hypothetical protein